MYVLTIDTHATDRARVQRWVNDLDALSRAKEFLKTSGSRAIILTDNHKSRTITPGNRQLIADGLPLGQRGHAQKRGTRLIWINPNERSKPFVNTLVHELGHFKWSGLGHSAMHDKVFYRLLNDTLLALGLEVHRTRDLNNIDISGVRSPAGTNPLTYEN